MNAQSAPQPDAKPAAAADLLILGTGPHALEIGDLVADINRVAPRWRVVGFVSAFADQAGMTLAGLGVLTLADALERYPTAWLITEYEWPAKQSLPHDRLATLVHPTTFVASSARIGAGSIIYPHCFVGSNARVGDFLFCLANVVINHNDVLGEEVTLTSGVVIAGDVHIAAHCYLGQSCVIRERVRIGPESLIGMGAVVLRDVAANSVMVGNPARRLRARTLNFPGANVLRAAKRGALARWRRGKAAMLSRLGVTQRSRGA
ncbi:MAG TPA: acetyltransferase [Ktedonobacterales bacterium]|nr:acetyltransferase [Ktedonobacterales bacterium]